MLPDLLPATKGRVPRGSPGKYDYKDPGVYTLENAKSIKELGIRCECAPAPPSRGRGGVCRIEAPG
jgi:hypothetical protein